MGYVPALIATRRMTSMTTTNDSSVYYDPFDVDINADPYPTFRRLRDEAPIYYNERYDVWALSRHSDVEKGLVDWQVFSSSRGDILEIIQSGMEAPSGVVLWEDPPVHALHRGLLSPGVHPEGDERARGQGAGVLRAVPRPPRRRRPVRLRHRPGRGDADASDRHAARDPRRRSAGDPRPVRRRHPDEAGPADAGEPQLPHRSSCSRSTSTGAPSTRPTTS